MATFLISYRMPVDYQPVADGVSDRWKAWFQSLGPAVTTIGNPVTDTAEVGDCGAGTRLGGYSVITADDREAALAMVRSCPAAEAGGVEVGLIIEPPGLEELRSA